MPGQEDRMIEEWRTIAGYPDYAVSSRGRIQRLTSRTCAKAGTILKLTPRGKSRYLCVCLCHAGKVKLRAVHTIVAETFHGERPVGQVPNHLDGNRENNRADNLEWGTQSHNVAHAYAMGLADAKGERNGQAKLTVEEVLAIRASYTGGRGEQTALARHYGVHPTTIRDIVARRRWPHI